MKIDILFNEWTICCINNRISIESVFHRPRKVNFVPVIPANLGWVSINERLDMLMRIGQAVSMAIYRKIVYLSVVKFDHMLYVCREIGSRITVDP